MTAEAKPKGRTASFLSLQTTFLPSLGRTLFLQRLETFLYILADLYLAPQDTPRPGRNAFTLQSLATSIIKIKMWTRKRHGTFPAPAFGCDL